MAPRSIWNGSVAFGEVVVPVKLFSATRKQRISFREVRLSDGSRISHKRFGAESGEEVASERIARAYETGTGEQIVLSDEEIAEAAGARSKTIEIDEFVRTAEIDTIFLDRTYILAPQAGAEHAYRVMHDALERSGKAGLGRLVLRTREQFVALTARDGALRIYTLRFADEIVKSSELDAPKLGEAPAAKEATLAERLIEALGEPWQPERYENHYRDAVMAVIERKASGGEVKVEVPEKTTPTPDLMAALQASLEQRRGKGSGVGKAAARKTAARKQPAGKPPAGKPPTGQPPTVAPPKRERPKPGTSGTRATSRSKPKPGAR